MIAPSFVKLPNEVLQQIFLYVPPTSLAALLQVSWQCNILAGPVIWRYHCLNQFEYWEQGWRVEDIRQEQVHAVDWKGIYAERYRIDLATRRGLNGVLSSQRNRIEKIQQIVLSGEDAKDALLDELRVEDEVEDILARRYYSGAILGCIHRARAVKEWTQLLQGIEVPLETALGAFDLFIIHGRERDFQAISNRLDELADGVQSRYSDILQQSPRQKAVLIARHLREQGFRGAEDADRYADLQNNFLGITLHQDKHPLLPLTSVAIYCSIAKRLDLNAKPCNYPWHVFAIIYPSPGQDLDGNAAFQGLAAEAMYMDPYRTHLEIPVEDLLAQLRTMGVSKLECPSYIMGASATDMTLRSARNIINSVQSVEQTTTVGDTESLGNSSMAPALLDTEGAFYGALWASLLLGSLGDSDDSATVTIRNQRQFLTYIVKRLEVDFPFDLSLLEEYVLPIFETRIEGEHLRKMARDMRNADSKPKQVKARIENEAQRVSYHVGQVFQHKRYLYQAVIIGWDAECAAHESWITQMRVNELARGRYQCFYNVLVADKSVRYVAEDNIEIITPEIPHSLMELAGRYFKRWDKKAYRFVSNIRDEYPDD